MSARLATALTLLAFACGSLKDAVPEAPARPTGGDEGGPNESPKADGGTTGDDDDDATSTTDGGNDAGPCAGPCKPEVVAESDHTPGALAVDSKNVYFASNAVSRVESAVYACPKAGCGSAATKLGAGDAAAVAVIGSNVYWSDRFTSSILSCATTGCSGAPKPIATGEMDVLGVWTDGIRLVWWASMDGGSIRYCNAAACVAATAKSGLGSTLTGFAADQGSVVWSDYGNTFGCALDSCAAPLTLGPGTTQNVIYGVRLFSIAGATITSCAVTGCNQMPGVFGTSKTPVVLTTDGTFVFWRDSTDEAIYRCYSGGCNSPPTALATEQVGPGSAGIATDGLYVYWSTNTRVMRVRKTN